MEYPPGKISCWSVDVSCNQQISQGDRDSLVSHGETPSWSLNSLFQYFSIYLWYRFGWPIYRWFTYILRIMLLNNMTISRKVRSTCNYSFHIPWIFSWHPQYSQICRWFPLVFRISVSPNARGPSPTFRLVVPPADLHLAFRCRMRPFLVEKIGR